MNLRLVFLAFYFEFIIFLPVLQEILHHGTARHFTYLDTWLQVKYVILDKLPKFLHSTWGSWTARKEIWNIQWVENYIKLVIQQLVICPKLHFSSNLNASLAFGDSQLLLSRDASIAGLLWPFYRQNEFPQWQWGILFSGENPNLSSQLWPTRFIEKNLISLKFYKTKLKSYWCPFLNNLA